MRRFLFSDPDFQTAFKAFLDERRGSPADVDAAVAGVLEAVRTQGIEALLDYSRRFDKVDLTAETIRVTAEEIEAGAAETPADVREAIAFAAARIRAYHSRQRPADQAWTDEAGVELGWRWTPLEAVGVYVPGGRAAYPSTVLMNAVPAQVAGVDRIAMVTPPGKLQPAVLAAAKEAGVTEIWRVGGAQAVAALAYGAGPIQPVDKIVGPGNAYVTAAKRRLYGVVGIDALAGPSEIVVVADNKNNPDWIAADLLSQAEHDPAAQSILITDDEAFAAAVEQAIAERLKTLATGEDAAASWRDHGAVIIAPLDESPALVDAIAPEHVEFALDNPERLSDRVRHAGAIFLGRVTPEAIGDYVAGSNHVLPTSRAARFQSGLSIYDFIKRTSIVKCDPASFAVLGPHTVALAKAEGLPAHALSASVRLPSGD
ncbi:histidinol dehydrogenase [Caulobacter vibrioides]|uniref:Histidinol dehydrogenase n=2 Tax=Caulobacter vibrioides TaxID=155892 RepID=HISX_CAUVC|nr:histidinol dehydrogenase [Caulobacter vibrioides]YP_002517804.1 histidinol dehydrogenase [Caulobacter vibrioides NA1000]Q9A5V1.1 RecName: Full=Histidinol dehydrogenase; Short=HDH [Caulobacter vibrioides CB15]AAK24317.1 histidinol dehydrogenase [Caulobacter vibrioides CB15]ACL95896.1 histidinol dehydrogenase [Caulobacter vibrioides NA1000]ATC29208.1 histidinol dehydrogenase [Caulobacter vibrioides]QXZ50720.1 histidinol dehydrogenase [Caulobacter vibrioides]